MGQTTLGSSGLVDVDDTLGGGLIERLVHPGEVGLGIVEVLGGNDIAKLLDRRLEAGFDGSVLGASLHSLAMTFLGALGIWHG